MSIFRKRAKIVAGARGDDLLPVDLRIVELRPCLVGGRRAIFHRWINTAHPVPPRGMEINESTRYFQYRKTEAIVEYEDGTVDRVFPTEIKFVDGGAFALFDWSGAGGGTDGKS